MTFQGTPVRHRGETVGHFFLGEKQGAAAFTFTLPTVEDTRDASAARGGARKRTRAPAREARRPERILVVDDDPKTLRYVREILTGAGYRPAIQGLHQAQTEAQTEVYSPIPPAYADSPAGMVNGVVGVALPGGNDERDGATAHGPGGGRRSCAGDER